MDRKDSLSLLHSVWSLSWAGSDRGTLWQESNLYRIIWWLLHSLFWWLMLAFGWALDRDYWSKHPYGASPCGDLASPSMWMAFVSQNPKRQGLKVAIFWRPWSRDWSSLTSSVLFLPSSRGRDTDLTTRREECQCHIVVRRHGGGCMVVVIFGNHNLPQLLLLLILCFNSYKKHFRIKRCPLQCPKVEIREIEEETEVGLALCRSSQLRHFSLVPLLHKW